MYTIPLQYYGQMYSQLDNGLSCRWPNRIFESDKSWKGDRNSNFCCSIEHNIMNGGVRNWYGKCVWKAFICRLGDNGLASSFTGNKWSWMTLGHPGLHMAFWPPYIYHKTLTLPSLYLLSDSLPAVQSHTLQDLASRSATNRHMLPLCDFPELALFRFSLES